MFTTAIIAFREFLEAFLLVGIFIGVNKKLQLGKQKEILFAASVGIALSLALPIVVFLFAGNVSQLLTEHNTDILEGYFLIFSGFFLAYVVFSLHTAMKEYRNKTIAHVHSKIEQQIFDFSLFLTIVFFIAREGFEVALLVATTSVFSVFGTNLAGLLLGFFFGSVVGLSTLCTYISFPIKKVFRYTEYAIVVMGAAMVMNGISTLFSIYSSIHLEKIIPLPFQFLPDESSIIGHLLKNTIGLQKNMGFLQVVLMATYIAVVYILFLYKGESKPKELRG